MKALLVSILQKQKRLVCSTIQLVFTKAVIVVADHCTISGLAASCHSLFSSISTAERAFKELTHVVLIQIRFQAHRVTYYLACTSAAVT